jgi:glutamate 5-kinase
MPSSIGKFLVIKVGSNVLTQDDGLPAIDRLEHLVSQLTHLRKQGIKLILISSGAVAFGRQQIKLPEKLGPIIKKQIWASTGQINLIQQYKQLFEAKGIQIAQLLVTKEDFRDRKHFLNMRSCIEGLLTQDILPILNENDAVAITELMFTDNDELASLTAAMMNADSLILLTNVDGVYNGPPNQPGSSIIQSIEGKAPDLSQMISPQKSSFGRGGMLTKLRMAIKAADLGIQVIIANGKRSDILIHLLNKSEIPHTVFKAREKKQSSKKWLAFGEQYFKAEVVVNEGASKILRSEKINSLLPVGICSVKGSFVKGDIISICDEMGQQIGVGKAEYNSEQLNSILGIQHQKPFIHYDYLYILHHD